MILRPALLVLALAASSLAQGQALDPPERVARLSYAEGRVMFQGPGDASPSGLPDRPLMPGDRLTTERDARAELALGTATIRLNEQTEFSVIALDAATVRIELTAGSAIVHLRELLEGESFEFTTPNATIAMHSAGEYRVNVFADDATELTVRAGAAEVTTTDGPVRIADGQRVRLEGRDALASLAAPLPADAFDDWVLEREVQLAEAQPPPGETLEGYEDEALDDYGEWYDEPNYGRVWMPSYAYGGYDPFRYGHWQRVGYGWGWVDTMPWGFYTSNYGRWAYLHDRNRWCWVPTRRDHRRHFAHDTRPYRRPRDDARHARRPAGFAARCPRAPRRRRAQAEHDFGRAAAAHRFGSDAGVPARCRIGQEVTEWHGRAEHERRSESAAADYARAAEWRDNDGSRRGRPSRAVSLRRARRRLRRRPRRSASRRFPDVSSTVSSTDP